MYREGFIEHVRKYVTENSNTTREDDEISWATVSLSKLKCRQSHRSGAYEKVSLEEFFLSTEILMVAIVFRENWYFR